MSTSTDPHAGQPLIRAGLALEEAGRAVVMIHGRNASPRNILDLMPRLDRPEFAYLAPAAANRTWYPFSFLVERHKNEPVLDLGDRPIEPGGQRSYRSRNIDRSHCASGLFTGCMSCSGVRLSSSGPLRRHRAVQRRADWTTWHDLNCSDRFAGTPIFLGCSDVDAHVPQFRVDESADVFTRMGAEVFERIYPGMGHVVSDDEIAGAQSVLDGVYMWENLSCAHAGPG